MEEYKAGDAGKKKCTTIFFLTQLPAFLPVRGKTFFYNDDLGKTT